MKIIKILVLAILFTSCGSTDNKTESSKNDNNPNVDYSSVDKFLGKWSAEDKPGELISISKISNFDSAQVCIVNDGKTEFSFPYVVKEDKFKARQPEYWVEILHDKVANQLLWKVTRYDEMDGKVVRKYNFKSK